MMQIDLSEIDAALAGESWEWLLENAPALAAAVQKCVARGATPDQIFRHVLAGVGESRAALAYRVRLAALYLNGREAK